MNFLGYFDLNNLYDLGIIGSGSILAFYESWKILHKFGLINSCPNNPKERKTELIFAGIFLMLVLDKFFHKDLLENFIGSVRFQIHQTISL